jgi:hypothetical protein
MTQEKIYEILVFMKNNNLPTLQYQQSQEVLIEC